MAATALFKTAALPDLEQVEIIRGGLPASDFSQLVAAFGLPANLLAAKLGMGLRTVNRQIKARGKLSGDMAERMLRAARIRNLASSVFTDDDAISEWLRSPAIALNGANPIDLLDTDVGARTVESLIQGIAYGNVI